MNPERNIILFTSDCYSEDRNATLIGSELRKLISLDKKLDGTKIMGASLVSEGEEYKKRGFEVIASSYLPPSGGFSTQSLRGFFQDLISGSFSIPKKFVSSIKTQKDKIRLAFVVGDVFLLYLTRKALKKTNIPILFYIHSKTDYIQPHYWIEEWYIRKAASAVFARDELTASNLRSKGINSYYFGSVIMDELNPVNFDLELNPIFPTIGILPGTRGEAVENLMLILNVLELLSTERSFNFIVALVNSITDEMIISKASKNGWTLKANDDKKLSFLEKEKIKVTLARGAFVDVVIASEVLIGLSGAGNEQAVGLGKPVVSFVGTGPQTTKRRFIEQEKLLGGSMKFIKDYPYGVVQEVLDLINNPVERERRGRIGIERMGPSGGARKIAKFVYENYLKKV